MKRDLAKFNEAQKLRISGVSIRKIAHTLGISSSTASIWCRNIELSKQQREKLSERGKSAELLRSFAQKRHEEKLKRNDKLFEKSKNEIEKISKNELFLTGLALYWAEGFKNEKEQRVGFCNSDPRMIKFMMKWFREALNVTDKDFTMRAEFNQVYEAKKEEIEIFWSKLTGIHLDQFNKPYLQKAKWNRYYPNRSKYFGLLRIRIKKSSQLLVKLRGWIEGLSLG